MKAFVFVDNAVSDLFDKNFFWNNKKAMHLHRFVLEIN